MQINSAKDLTVYQKAYKLAMAIFEVSKGFPPEERYALTSQIRRSSRSGRIYKLREGQRATKSRCNHHAKPAFAG